MLTFVIKIENPCKYLENISILNVASAWPGEIMEGVI